MRNSYLVLSIGIAIATHFAPSALGVPVNRRWLVNYDGPGHRTDEPSAMVVDADGSVYVGGTTYAVGQNDNLLLLKYSPDGILLWDTIFNHPANGYERVSDIALDHQGNIIVVGPERHADGPYRTVWKFEPAAGGLLWSFSLQDSSNCGFHQDLRGGAVVTADDCVLLGGCGFEVVKLAPDGQVLWSRAERPADAIDLITDIAVAGDGRILCGGVSSASNAGSGVVAYDADGNFLWRDVQLGNHGAVFGPANVAFDEAGNAIAAFEPETSCGLFSILLVKYDPAGEREWITPYSANPCNTFSPGGMVIANENEIYIVGSLGGSSNLATIKFNGSGQMAWERMHDGPLHSTDIGVDIALDALGNVYVTGTELNTGAQDRDMVTISYDPAGNQRWIVSEGSPTHANDFGLAIGLFGCGQIYTAGYGFFGGNSMDVFVVRYDQPVAGDLDGDGDSDLIDFAALQNHFGVTSGAQPEDGDLDGDEDVDFADFDLFAACFVGPI